MANKQGTRWRGQIPIPSHAHPLVRRLIEIANEQMTTLSEVGKKAGQSPKTISDWRYRSVPRLDNFEACLNAMGYELIVREMRNPKNMTHPSQLEPNDGTDGQSSQSEGSHSAVL